jgi:hypothetical protein
MSCGDPRCLVCRPWTKAEFEDIVERQREAWKRIVQKERENPAKAIERMVK